MAYPESQVSMLSAKQHATAIVGTLREHGYLAYLCGGCVRDLLLGREPADYDVATDATPQEVMRIFPETYAVGAQFGVVLVPAPSDERFDPPPQEHGSSGETADAPASSPAPGNQHKAYVEVATFRSDVGYSDGRHPDQVRFSR